MPGKGRNTDRRRQNSKPLQRAIKELKASEEGGICCFCGGEIDRSLPPSEYNSPGYWTANHTVPLAEGGDVLGEIKPAHKGCNSRHGALLLKAIREAAELGAGVQPDAEYSRVW